MLYGYSNKKQTKKHFCQKCQWQRKLRAVWSTKCDDQSKAYFNLQGPSKLYILPITKKQKIINRILCTTLSCNKSVLKSFFLWLKTISEGFAKISCLFSICVILSLVLSVFVLFEFAAVFLIGAYHTLCNLSAEPKLFLFYQSIAE